MIWTPKQTVGAAIGQNIVLECVLESYPRSITHWSRLNGPSIIESSAKHESIVSETSSSVYKSEMMLKINNVSLSDFGSYVCSAKNVLGETTGRIKVYEIPKSSLPPPSSTKSHKATISHKGPSDEKIKKEEIVIGSKTEASSSSSGKRKGMTGGKKNPSDLHSKPKTLERNQEEDENDEEEEDESKDDEEETLRSSLRSRTRGLSTPSSSSSSAFSSILFCLHQRHSYSTMPTKILFTSSPLFPFLIFYFLSFLNAPFILFHF